MITLNDIFRQYGPAYRAQYGDRMLPSHRAAMTALEACRTDALYQSAFSCILYDIVIRRIEHRIPSWHVLPVWHRI